MALTRATITTEVKYTFTRQDKDTQIALALQWILEDIADDFFSSEELKTVSGALTLTTSVATLDISSLTTLHGTRIEHVELIDSADEANNTHLGERPFDDFLRELPDPTDTTNASKGYPEWYARRGNTLYFYSVPGYTTLSVKIYFTLIHPATGVLYPDHFDRLIVIGTIWQSFDMVEHYSKAERWRQLYEELKTKKISAYKSTPNLEERAHTFL